MGIGAANRNFNNAYAGVSRDAVSVVHLDCAATVMGGDKISLRPHIEFNTIINNDVRTAVSRADNITLGFVLTYEL